MRTSILKRVLLSLALVILYTGASSAGTIYTDPTSFLGALQPGYYLENFNSVDTSPSTVSLNFSGNGFAYTAYAPGALYAGSWSGDGQLFGVNQHADALTFTFTSGNVTAIGGYYFVTDIVNNVLPGTVTLNFSDGTSAFVTSGSPVPFLGYVSSTPLSSLTISGPGSGHWVSVDNFYVGASAVPEPATAALLGAGVLLLAALSRRTRAFGR